MKDKIVITKYNTVLEAKDIIKSKLIEKGAEITSDNENITFTAGLKSMFKSSPYSNLLSIISNGKILIDSENENIECKYKLNVFPFSIMILIMTVLIFLLVYNFFNSFLISLIICSVLISYIFIGNVLITKHRFRKYLNSFLTDSN